MRYIKDRIYGDIILPPRASHLALYCPVILRLREIRMANIPFFSHPSFANVDRYEHSVGVAHLAWRWANKNNLSRKDGEALCIAALYHDGATPAFGHLFEELLSWRTGFDHEKVLIDLLKGTGVAGHGRDKVQVFAGGSCLLRRILPKNETKDSHSFKKIIRILSDEDGLSKLIKGSIDFDNIDNVIRASSSMGLITDRSFSIHPYDVASALIIDNNGKLCIRSDKSYAIFEWQKIRSKLYKEILRNPFEFRYQTTMKWAIELWLDKFYTKDQAYTWKYTDPEITFRFLYKNRKARSLIELLRRGNPPKLLFCALFEDISPILGIRGQERIRSLKETLEKLSNLSIYTNYYVDKRFRDTELPTVKISNLFDQLPNQSLNRIGADDKIRGIVGAVYAPPLDMLDPMNIENIESLTGQKLPPKDLLLEIIKSSLGIEPVLFSSKWVYPEEKNKGHNQLNLF